MTMSWPLWSSMQSSWSALPSGFREMAEAAVLVLLLWSITALPPWLYLWVLHKHELDTLPPLPQQQGADTAAQDRELQDRVLAALSTPLGWHEGVPLVGWSASYATGEQ